MKHKAANIMYEGQGWNPYALVAEGRDNFKKRIIEEGHYQRDEEGMPYAEDERVAIADKAFDKAEAFVEKSNPKPAEKKADPKDKKPEQK